jgi:uncharacterized protein (UPF0332 family)
MTRDADIQTFLAKTEENLTSATVDFADGRYNACANRAYYAAFQAAIAAPMRSGIWPQGATGVWGHGFVQAQFAGQLVNRRKLFPPELRDTLPRLEALREKADYEASVVNRREASRALELARALMRAVTVGGERR